MDGSDGCACDDDHAATAADTDADTMLTGAYKHDYLQALAQTYSAEMQALRYEPTEDGLYKLIMVTRAGERPIQTIKIYFFHRSRRAQKPNATKDNMVSIIIHLCEVRRQR